MSDSGASGAKVNGEVKDTGESHKDLGISKQTSGMRFKRQRKRQQSVQFFDDDSPSAGRNQFYSSNSNKPNACKNLSDAGDSGIGTQSSSNSGANGGGIMRDAAFRNFQALADQILSFDDPEGEDCRPVRQTKLRFDQNQSTPSSSPDPAQFQTPTKDISNSSKLKISDEEEVEFFTPVGQEHAATPDSKNQEDFSTPRSGYLAVVYENDGQCNKPECSLYCSTPRSFTPMKLKAPGYLHERRSPYSSFSSRLSSSKVSPDKDDVDHPTDGKENEDVNEKTPLIQQAPEGSAVTLTFDRDQMAGGLCQQNYEPVLEDYTKKLKTITVQAVGAGLFVLAVFLIAK